MRLFLCEKPSQAKDIGKVLGATRRANGYLEGNGVTITWCIGHLLEAAAPEAYHESYKRWEMSTLPILPQTWQVQVKPPLSQQFQVVKKLLSQTKELVIATDADREGEMIARELIDYCGYKGHISRLWLSALNDVSIRKALDELKPGAETLPLYHSALSRSRADWLIGMNMTRLFTLIGRQAGYDGILSVGRVQTPTLGLVVRRDREIQNFVPIPYWAINVSLFSAGRQFHATWQPPENATDDAGRCIMTTVARDAVHKISTVKSATVQFVDIQRKQEAPPLVFDLSTLQDVCSKKLGLSVQETLDIAQALYETHKATSYPRTDCGYLPESMIGEIPAVLAALVKTDPTIAPLVKRLNTHIRSRIWNDKKVTAHHGIVPTVEPANLSAMNEKELAVYQLIRAYYLAQLMPNYEYDRTLVQLDCNGETLITIGKQVIIAGWKMLFNGADEEDDTQDSQTLPALTVSTHCNVVNSELQALKTKPPKPYTQGDLIKAMKGVAQYVTDPILRQKLRETTGIGTEATRAGIINGLLQRGYLVNKGKAVCATEAAFTLIDAAPPEIVDPGMTALWEQALECIEKGTVSADQFLRKQTQWVRQLVEQYRNVALSITIPQGPQCPKCGTPMKKRQSKNGPFWSCSTFPACNATLPIGNTKSQKRKKKIS
ncbi:DNA topoisomerase 3 [Saezia sanguinis]|uniref:DNA topoisomerase n=1 Tax=Saezia sanguinis TaxID=1965230 RepID=A0A433SFC8_9BURK|nr:DNA topoisomerase III [Saezia sanguinis]RUS67438.1 DNA topoisomerase 3 [Saezia sanguinis]